MKKIILMAMAAMIVSSNAYCTEWKDTDNKEELINLLIEFPDGLKDPASVQLKNLKKSMGSKYPEWCGEMNAKNSYGAYAGFKKFHFTTPFTKKVDTIPLTIEGRTPSSADRVDQYCK